jgi:hypothetical protein
MTTPAPAAASPEVKTPATPASTAAPEVKKEGTTSKLFKDLEGTGVPGAPQKPEASKEAPAPATPTPEPTKVAPAPAPAQAEVLDLEALKGKKIKMIVDGKEELVSAEDALRRLQLDSHLTQKATTLSEKERVIVEREKALKKPVEVLPVDEESILSDDPLVKKLLARTEALERKVAEADGILAKQKYQENLDVLAAHVKTTYGADDFRTYVPKIEEIIRNLPPERRNVTNQDTLGIYQELKMKDLISGSHAAVAPKTVERPASAPMVVEGAEGAARVQLDDWDLRYQTALAKAKASGSEEDWANVMVLKREIPKAA